MSDEVLVEHDDGPGGIAEQHVAEENILQRVAFQHQPLVRRITGDQPGEIARRSIFDREIGRQFPIEAGDAFLGCPQLAVVAFRVLERGFHGVDHERLAGLFEYCCAHVWFLVSLGDPCQPDSSSLSASPRSR